MRLESAERPLAGKSALVTGASGEVGAAAALTLARAGTRVVLSGRNHEKLEILASQIERITGEEPPILAADLTSAPQVGQLARQAAERSGGRLDILLNAAGVGATKRIESLTPENLQTMLAVNLYSAMLLSQAAVRVMGPQRSGHILHVVGVQGKLPRTKANSDKYGLTDFLRSLRAEVSQRYNIKVTALYLGGIDTSSYENSAAEIPGQCDKRLTAGDASDAVLFALTRSAHLVLDDLTPQASGYLF